MMLEKVSSRLSGLLGNCTPLAHPYAFDLTSHLHRADHRLHRI
jgi:hypothetical protein